jgi:aprataxin
MSGSPSAAAAAEAAQQHHSPPYGIVSDASPAAPAAAAAGPNAFAALMRGAKEQQQQQGKPQASPAGKGTKPAAPAAPAAAAGGGWNTVLSSIAADPERHRAVQSIWHVDGQVVGMLDKYPKARHHALLLAREPGLHRASQLRLQHLPLLTHMRQLALAWIQQQQQQQQHDVNHQQDAPQDQQAHALVSVPDGWRLGFHSVPSMAQLHLHVISTDFDSPCLKTKRHWNSFTSGFFLQLDDVMAALQVIPETTSKEKQKPEIPVCSAMVAGAPSRHVSTALCCMILTTQLPAIPYTAGPGWRCGC